VEPGGQLVRSVGQLKPMQAFLDRFVDLCQFNRTAASFKAGWRCRKVSRDSAGFSARRPYLSQQT
jgi:hypothetical protein